MADKELREMLVRMLREANAHVMMDDLVEDFPATHRGTKQEGFAYSPWQLLEHMRIAQRDILEFSTDPDYEAPDWPDDYWPKEEAPASTSQWNDSIEAFNAELEQMAELIANEENDLFEPFAHGDGQNLLREALLLMKHNSYHMGQLVMMRKFLKRRG